ncbi:hypothetical protein [Heyndrickxia coagulans]|uniref:hypothetical protein n=1 Tax=Heyndrickxia coagulans TaxID=1398 RepID=UPI0022358334|nr:hypothetical protein [Heyndrickxia coagulans]UZH06412.1 hypothetical protein ONG97_00260 [Heyndrickxia coagulans]UZH06462.1 hypothetical protein ONG97_00560 [Heyndrickxia coagulans]
MISKLTDVFKKNPDSNIGKIFSIVGAQMDDLQSTLDKMELWRDIDEAEGVVLDRIGLEILQEPRGGVSDKEYRLKLKTRIIVNYLSGGDIETLNQLLEVYLGDHLVSVETAANVKEGPFAKQPATIIVTIKGQDEPITIPYEEISKVLSGGVGTQWEYINERLWNLVNQYQHIMYPFEYFSGWVGPGGVKQTNGNVDAISNFNFKQQQDETLQEAYPLAGVYEQQNDNAGVKQEYDLSDSSVPTIQPAYMICGDNNATADAGNNMQLSALSLVTLQKAYPICGTFVAGEVV